MSWLSGYKYRTPITVENSGGVLTTVDAAATLPPEWPEFWDTILSSGYDVRVTSADGVTAVSYKLSSFTYASKLAVVALNDVTVVASTQTVFWLYWGNASATDGQAVFTPASIVDAFVVIEPPNGLYVRCVEEASGVTKPAQVIVKKVDETTDVYIDFGRVMSPRDRPYAGSRAYEEISSIVTCRIDSGGAAQAGMVTATKHRIGPRSTVKMRILGGTTATDYTGICRILTTLGRTLEARFLLRVRNPVE